MRGNLAEMRHPWDEIVAYAARGTALQPGDVIGSGVPGREAALVERGDLVELEVERIGVLRNRLV